MQKSQLILLSTLIFGVLLSCTESNNTENEEPEMETITEAETVTEMESNCVFEQIDDNFDGYINGEEQRIIRECLENQLTSIAEIETNLIGSWKLVGHGEGWTPTKSQPCAHIIFSSDSLVFEFENATIDTITTLGWAIAREDTNFGPIFELILSPRSIEGLRMDRFCSEYMFSDETPFDGNMYLYQKIQ